jgi:CubicO group peptidase (beta-lactamase class C family)
VTNRSFLALLFVTACSSTDAASPDAAAMPEGDLPIEPRFQALADRIDAERVELGAPGVAVLVMENGTITFAHGFGLKNPDAPDEVDAGTLFRIGSVTKVLTATALLEFVASGQVGLDDPVTRARRPERWLAQLVHHRRVLDVRVPDGTGGTDVELLQSQLHACGANRRER